MEGLAGGIARQAKTELSQESAPLGQRMRKGGMVRMSRGEGLDEGEDEG